MSPSDPGDESLVRELLHRRAGAVTFTPVNPETVIHRGDRTRRRRRIGGGVLASVCIAGALAAAISTAGTSRDAQRPAGIIPVSPAPSSPGATTPAPPAPTSAAALPTYTPPPPPAGWSPLPAAPLTRNPVNYGSAKVGGSVAYWGQTDTAGPNGYSNRGAVLDPKTRTWTPMPASPLIGRSFPALAGSDHVLFVWGGNRGGARDYDDGATYDLTTRTWRKVARSPLAAQVASQSVWTGTEFLVIGAAGGRDPGMGAQSAAYNPATDTWRQLPSLPTPLTKATVLRIAGQTVVMGSLTPTNQNGANYMFTLPDGGAAWTSLTPPPNAEPATFSAATDGITIFATARRQHLKAPAPEPLLVMAYDYNTGTWQDLQNPFNPPECYTYLTASETGIWETGCTSSVYNRATRTWKEKPLPPGTFLVVGSTLVSSDAIGSNSP